jgi:hypothetical protein
VARATVRTHIVVPEDLVSSIDRLVGKRARSRFFVEAAEEKLARERRARIFKAAAGDLADVPIPGWDSSEAGAAWVRRSRARDRERLERLIEEAG